MDYNQILELVIKTLLVPSITLIAWYITSYIKVKTTELRKKFNNKQLDNYLRFAEECITTSVMATQQTFVDELKKEGKFDKAAAQNAFKKAEATFKTLINDDAKIAIEKVYGDYDKWVESQIEKQISFQKNYY